MNSQREAFEKFMAGRFHIDVRHRASTNMARQIWDAACTWQAATEQGVGEPVAWREYTVQPAESLAGIAARQLGDESRAGEIGLLNNLNWEDAGLYPFNPGDVIKLPILKPPPNQASGTSE